MVAHGDRLFVAAGNTNVANVMTTEMYRLRFVDHTEAITACSE